MSGNHHKVHVLSSHSRVGYVKVGTFRPSITPILKICLLLDLHGIQNKKKIQYNRVVFSIIYIFLKFRV